MCIGMCVDVCTDTCIGMCIDMRTNMCIGMCIDMRTNMCMGIRVDKCMDTWLVAEVMPCESPSEMQRHVCGHVCRLRKT